MRFRQVQENMNRLKRSYQAQVTYSLLDLFGRGPDVLERRALSMLSNKASAYSLTCRAQKNLYIWREQSSPSLCSGCPKAAISASV